MSLCHLIWICFVGSLHIVLLYYLVGPLAGGWLWWSLFISLLAVRKVRAIQLTAHNCNLEVDHTIFKSKLFPCQPYTKLACKEESLRPQLVHLTMSHKQFWLEVEAGECDGDESGLIGIKPNQYFVVLCMIIWHNAICCWHKSCLNKMFLKIRDTALLILFFLYSLLIV